MFIIWGKKAREERRGFVADLCPTCRTATHFELTDHYQVGHIYYIPLGKGTLVTTSRRCLQCNGMFDAYPHEYASIERDGNTMLIEQLLNQTNPLLAHSIAERAQLETLAQAEAAQGPPPIGPDGQPPQPQASARLRLAAKKLEGVDESHEKAELMQRMTQWADLDGGQQNSLLAEVDQFVEEFESVQRTVTFIHMVSTTFNGQAGCVPGFLGLVATGMPFIFFPPVRSWLWGTLVVVAGIVISFVIFGRMLGAYVRKWTEKTLIPQMESNQIDAQIFIALLASANEEKGLDEKISDLASNYESIAATLIEKGVFQIDGLKQ